VQVFDHVIQGDRVETPRLEGRVLQGTGVNLEPDRSGEFAGFRVRFEPHGLPAERLHDLQERAAAATDIEQSGRTV
jgi:hypothetical protein